MNINKRLLKYIQSMRIYMAVVVLLSLLTGLFIVLQARSITQLIDGTFLLHQSLKQLTGVFVLLLLVISGRATLIWINEAVTNLAACTVKSDLRRRLFTHIFKLGPTYIKAERSGEIVNTATEGVEALDAYFNLFFPQLCATMIIPIIILVVVFDIDLPSGIILLVTLPILPFFMILIGKQANATTQKRWQQLSQMSAHFLDVLQGLTTLKLFGRAHIQQNTIRQISNRFGDTTMKVLRIAFLSSLVMEMGATISTALVAVEIGLRLLYGNIPFGLAFFVLLLTPEFYQPLRALGAQFHASMSSADGAQRIFDILETPSTQPEPIAQPTIAHSVQFKDIHYSYEAADQPAIRGVSFTLRKGEKVALVGASGAGKSTLAHLLLRFIEPEQGAIYADDRPIQQFSASDWRKLVAWQPQRPYLFNTTVAENIRMGRSDATMEEVAAAARQANIDTFIQTLPEGYETLVGERGARFSGGQVQRLSLARAFLKDAPILILDEATSTLDVESESEVLQAINAIMQDRMVLTIAHRLNTISNADQIIVLEQGRVVATGTHPELLQHSPLYQGLVRAYTDEEAVI